jgi:hypothetical protein
MTLVWPDQTQFNDKTRIQAGQAAQRTRPESPSSAAQQIKVACSEHAAKKWQRFFAKGMI